MRRLLIRHTFLGWYYEDTFTELAELDVMPASDITLYAKWETNVYIIAFENNGGEIGDTVLPRDQEYGSLIVEPVLPAREKYDFIGWYSDVELLDLWVNAQLITVGGDEIIMLKPGNFILPWALNL